MTDIETIRRRQRWGLIEWPLIWALTAAAFALGLVGFPRMQAAAPLTALDVLYCSL